MMEYANESVIKALRQYDMLLKSLKFISDVDQRNDICMQMTRIIEQVLNVTNSIYEEKYNKVLHRSTYLMDEEKNRLLEIINLINERRAYVNNQIANNEEVTGMSFEIQDILGEDKLEDYKNEVKIIDKYKNNIKLEGILKDELANLEVNIKRAKDKISNNKMLNIQLEDRMIKLLERAFTSLGLYELQERSEEIDLAYTELGFSLEKAKENAKLARKDCTEDIIMECDNMLASITLDYERYKEKKFILRLIDVYRTPCEDYETLLRKREEMNNILSNITSSELYHSVGNELNKEYATIKLERQDVATLNSLLEEYESKKNTLLDITRENDSDEFKSMLSNLLENEKKHQEKLMQEKKKKEAEMRARKMQEEKRMQEEILKRQRLLEEERKKEIERRTKQLLDEKKNPVLITEKEEKGKVSDFSRSSVGSVKNSNSRSFNSVGPKNGSNVRQLDRKNEELKKKIPSDSRIFRSENVSRESIDTDKRRVNSNFQRDNGEIQRERLNSNEGVTSSRENRVREDIFARSDKRSEEIPVIKSNHYDNKIVDVKKVTPSEEIFPKVSLKKENEIFPEIPDKNDSFFDDGEFQDLNKYMENDNKSWF